MSFSFSPYLLHQYKISNLLAAHLTPFPVEHYAKGNLLSLPYSLTCSIASPFTILNLALRRSIGLVNFADVSLFCFALDFPEKLMYNYSDEIYRLLKGMCMISSFFFA